jgi:dipicolinate synthase subunit B
MAIKSHLRNNKPVVLGISTNDGLSGSAKNLGELLNRKNLFFIPFRQDNPEGKPRSLVANWDKLIPTIEEAMEGRQIQPIIF